VSSWCLQGEHYKGHVDLGTVTEIRRSTRPDAPPHALDLVTDARVFTVAPATEELMQEWRHRIHAVVSAVSAVLPAPAPASAEVLVCV
jgi:hypothetical protein